MDITRTTRTLHAADVLMIAFLGLLSLINLIFSARIPSWKVLILINVVVTAAIFLLAYTRYSTGSRILAALHDWYVPPAVFLSFKELYYMIRPLHLGQDYDGVLIAIDRWIFGVNPTEWIYQFAHPVLTEVLQIAYTSFFFLFLIVGAEFYRRGNRDLFNFFVFTCVYGFFLSYLGYFLVPAIGPRFTLHDFSALDSELPGLWLTPYLRWFVNAGESIPMGVTNALAIEGTQRDVFPSGHTMMMLVLMYFGVRYQLKTRHWLNVVGILLIIATVYQRYHYVVDLVAGATFMIFCISTAPGLYVTIKRRLQTIESRLPRA
jgi:membrane-associated phospholipid phosphatase